MMPNHICGLDPKESSKVLRFIIGGMMKVKWIEPVLTQSLEEDGAGLVVLNAKIRVGEYKEALVITTEFVDR